MANEPQGLAMRNKDEEETCRKSHEEKDKSPPSVRLSFAHIALDLAYPPASHVPTPLIVAGVQT